MSREEVLDRVRRALAPRAAGTAVVERGYRRVGTRTRAELGGFLEERVSAYQATVQRAHPGGVRAAVTEICVRRGVQRLGIPSGLPAEWLPQELELVEDSQLTTHELDLLDGVITACEVAIAETGTIVLAGGAAQGRRALTLVPDVHVCVVPADRIVELVPEAIAVLHHLVRDSRRPLTCISGPSATSDIELDRVEGVHGPRTLEVVIVD